MVQALTNPMLSNSTRLDRRGLLCNPTLRRIGALFAFLGITVLASAQEPASEEQILPDGVASPLTLDQFQELLSNSPFRRLMSLSEDLVISGVAKFPSGTVVSVFNRRSRETYTVSAKENAQGWRLVDVIGGRNLEDIQATIQVGKQEVIIKFDPRRLSPESIRKSRPRRVKPGRSPEKPNVEQWLARLDPDLLRAYDELEDDRKNRFRYQFQGYLEEYPNASSELRKDFARGNLQAFEQQQTKELQATPGSLQNLDVGKP